MNRPCAFAVTCPGFDFPFLNASSEALDTLDYLGFGFAYGPGGNIPPLGQNWTVTACGVALFSTTDPNHAQLQAIADAIQCNALGRYPDQPVLTNNQQICCQPGPNGETCYTIENGIIGGQTVAEADQRASALACYFARRTAGRTFKINTPAGGCLNVPYLQDIRPTGGVPPYIISIVAGELPPGVVFHQDDARTGTLDGVPTVAGSYTFTVQVQDIAGNVLLRQDVTVGILAITNPTLPAAVVGTPYLEQILGAGGTPPYLFTTGVGFLPGGLTMDTSGLISGTPVVAADVFFTVTITDAAGTTCQQQCEINVTDACTPDTGPNVPTTWSNPQPARIRVVNYDANKFGIITGCGSLGVVTPWDGTLPVQYAPNNATLKYWPAGSAFPNVQNYLIQSSAAVIELFYVPTYFGTHGAWHMVIDCLGGGVIWEGLKDVGLDPTGTYMRLPSSQKAAGPACLKFESY